MSGHRQNHEDDDLFGDLDYDPEVESPPRSLSDLYSDPDDEHADNSSVGFEESIRGSRSPSIAELPNLPPAGQGNARSESAESDSSRAPPVFDNDNSRGNSVASSEDSLFVDQNSPLQDNRPDSARLDRTLDRARALRAQLEDHPVLRRHQSGERAQGTPAPIVGRRRQRGEDELAEMEIAAPRPRRSNRTAGPARLPANAAVIDLTAEDGDTDEDVVVVSFSSANSRGNSRNSRSRDNHQNQSRNRNENRNRNQNRNRTPVLIDLTTMDNNMDHLYAGAPPGFPPGTPPFYHAPAAYDDNGPFDDPYFEPGHFDNGPFGDGHFDADPFHGAPNNPGMYNDMNQYNHMNGAPDVNFGMPVDFVAGNHNHAGPVNNQGNRRGPRRHHNNFRRFGPNGNPNNNNGGNANRGNANRGNANRGNDNYGGNANNGANNHVPHGRGLHGVGDAVNPIELDDDSNQEDSENNLDDNDILVVEHPLGENPLVGIVRNVFMNGLQAFGGLIGRVNVHDDDSVRNRRARHSPPNMPPMPIATPLNPLAQNFPNFNYQGNGYNHLASRLDNEYKAPSPAPEGFTISTLDEDGEDVAICAGCDEELAFEDGAAPKDERPAKRQRYGRSRKEHHFWCLKMCGHVYCNDCYQKRNMKGLTVFPAAVGPGGQSRCKCAVEACDVEANGVSAWVGIFVS